MGNATIPVVRKMTGPELDEWAATILAEHFPDVLLRKAPLSVLRLTDVVLPGNYGVVMGVEVLPYGVEGVTEPPNLLTLGASVYDGVVDNNPRDRFTGAHESVHAILHLHQLQQRYESTGGVRLYRKGDVPFEVNPE